MSKRFIGSTLLIAGMAIGAGMLAIPLASAQLGFAKSTLLMLVCWAMMAASALVVLEVTLQFDGEENSFSQMAFKTLGRSGMVIMTLCFLSFIYALIAAYLSGGSSMITNMALHLFGISIPSFVSGLLFLFALGGVIYFGTSAVDRVNQFIFSGQMIVFLMLVALFMPQLDFSMLKVSESNLLLAAAPVVLTSFGFHLVIPSLVTYMGEEAYKLKWSLIIGSLIPMAVYLCWNAVVLGTLPLHGALSFAVLRDQQGSIGEMVVMINQLLESKILITTLNVFTNLALITSFLGVSLSLFDFWRKNLGVRITRFDTKGIAFSLTFLPPVLFLFMYPNGFIKALAFGSIFEAILCILLPVSMAYALRDRVNIVGGKATLITLSACAVGMASLNFIL